MYITMKSKYTVVVKHMTKDHKVEKVEEIAKFEAYSMASVFASDYNRYFCSPKIEKGEAYTLCSILSAAEIRKYKKEASI